MTHQWNFFRAGGFDQVQLKTGADLLALGELNQKLWVALSCPTRGIEFDTRTLDMIDSDHDGQVRANEVLAAINWAGGLLKNSDLFIRATDRLALVDIVDSTDEGKQILASVRHIFKSLGKADTSELSLVDIGDIEKLLASMQFNGDGVICAGQISDAGLRASVSEIGNTLGTVPDLSGDQGINLSLAEQFFTQAQAYLEWHKLSKIDPAILPLGDHTATAAMALREVREKVNDYFTRCNMAAYDIRSASPLSRSTEDYQQLAVHSLSAHNASVAEFPLATIAADKPLPLSAAINPAWRNKIEALRQHVVLPLLGNKPDITAAEWDMVCQKLSAFESWQAAMPISNVNQLDVVRLGEILSGSHRADIDQLIKQDLAVASEIKSMRSVERLLRYQRDLFKLANNFVSFSDFYSGRDKGIFQIGTLYLDGRSCDLCVKVEDVNTHAAFASSSGVCLVYCEVTRNSGAEKMNIAAAFTAGDSDFLIVGRHGVFYDRRGLDWNATITRIVDHPISIRQAFWSPYKKLSKAISEQLQKLAASKSNAVQEKLIKVAVENATASIAGTPPKPAFDVAKFAGVFAAIGLAIGAIGGILASLIGGILSLKFWQIPLALAGLMLAISLPSMVLAWFKLRKRTLGPILDACGWAVNARARINIPFGTSLTAMPNLPAGAHRSLIDPYAEKKSVWPYVIALLAMTGLGLWVWNTGYFAR